MSNQTDKRELIKSNQATVSSLLERLKPQMKMALPAHMTADRMVRIALTELRKSPKLSECEPMSFVASVMLCAQLGLEVGVLGQAFLVPFRNNKTGTTDCQFILGYKGMIDLARRSGEIISIAAHCVYSNDAFTYSYGLNESLEHKPTTNERGTFVAVYAVAKLKGGGHQFEVMSKIDVNFIRSKSKSSSSGPWVTDYDEMARKTAIRKLFKYLPASVEMQQAVSYEEQAETHGKDAAAILAEDSDVFGDFFDVAERVGSSATATMTVAAPISQADSLAEGL